jgi:hypothetical protein
MLIQKPVESDQREALGEAKKLSNGSAFSTVPSEKLATMQDEWVKMTTEERDTFRASLAPPKMDPAGRRPGGRRLHGADGTQGRVCLTVHLSLNLALRRLAAACPDLSAHLNERAPSLTATLMFVYRQRLPSVWRPACCSLLAIAAVVYAQLALAQKEGDPAFPSGHDSL